MERSMKCNTFFIAVIEKRLWYIASAGIINVHLRHKPNCAVDLINSIFILFLYLEAQTEKLN